VLYRVESVREADKGKNKGKKTGQNEITPGGGMTEICGFMRSSFRIRTCLSFLYYDWFFLFSGCFPVSDVTITTCSLQLLCENRIFLKKKKKMFSLIFGRS